MLIGKPGSYLELIYILSLHFWFISIASARLSRALGCVI